MKRLLTATTALALVGGTAFAEIIISGDAKLGLNYNSMLTDDNGDPVDNMSKHSFTHEMGVDFSGTGATDGGLSFGGSAGFDTGADATNEGTVFVSGAFGRITLGDNDSADKLSGGIADVGLNGVGVDDVVEDIYGRTANQFRYDQSVGNIALAISAGTSPGDPGMANARDLGPNGSLDATDGIAGGRFEVKKTSYAIGMSFNASGAKLGLGYDSGKTISVGFGYSTGQITANAFYAKGDKPYRHFGSDLREGIAQTGRVNYVDGTFDAAMTGIGVDVSYKVGASTLTLVYAKTDVNNIQPIWVDQNGLPSPLNTATVSFGSVSFKGMGIGFSHDLGGGASLVAGYGQVPRIAVADLTMAQIGQVLDGTDFGTFPDDRMDLSGDKNMASVGVSFSF